MATPEKTLLQFPPERPQGVKPAVENDFTKEYVTADGYSAGITRILGSTVEDVELLVGLEAFEKMENDPAVFKAKRIIITNALADELQFAPGATEDEVSVSEYKTYLAVMEFCQRVVAGLERPYRETLEQILGNGIRYGHGIAEVEYEYRIDGPQSKPQASRQPVTAKRGRFNAMLAALGIVSTPTPEAAEGDQDDDGLPAGPRSKIRVSLDGQKTRLMPKSIKVKPRGSVRFVVDDYMNILGLAPRFRGSYTTVKVGEVISRDKFIVLTLNKQDEDPRGKSPYRPAFNWANLKTQVPAELLRFILEEAVPKAVGTMPENPVPFEYERNAQGDIIYEDPETRQIPKMVTAFESFGRQIKGFRSGSGAVIPYGAKLEPFKNNGASDADFFNKVLTVIDRQIMDSLLLQPLAQSEGEHQARAASQTHMEILHSLVFWIRWLLGTMTLTDLCETAVRVNLGEWAIRYMPLISLGDFVRRDWAADLEVCAKAYFQGFLDDTQRPEIMAWLNLPKPGPSRGELMAEADMNGEPVRNNNARPDKAPGNDKRNDGNGTEKKPNASNNGLGPLNILGNHGRRFARSAGNIFTGGR